MRIGSTPICISVHRFVSLLCLRSTLRLFQFWIFLFWIFHRCDPMPNLKKFCHSLRHLMVSHFFSSLKSISKQALRLFDLILSKTRFSSHITFISRCLHGKVIPHGFRSSFNPLRFNLPAFHRRFSHSISEACSSHSRRLMRMIIKALSIHVQHIDENISQCIIFLSQVCPPILLSDIIDKIRVLNSKLHSFLLNKNKNTVILVPGADPDCRECR